MGYPSSIVSLTNPEAKQFLNAPSHSGIEKNQNAEIIAIEKELGLGLKGSLIDLVTRLAISIKSNGTLQVPFATKTSDYILTDNDCFIEADTCSGSFTITLPTAVGIKGTSYTIKKIDSSTNTVTIDANNLETIDGELIQIITNEDVSITILSDGSNWIII